MQILQIIDFDQKRVRITFEPIATEYGSITSMVLYKNERRRYDLQEGGELTQLQYQEIRNEILIKRAKKRAIYLLEKTDRTEMELRNKLLQGGYTADIIADVVIYVKKYRYIDDMLYAEKYIRYHSQKKSRLQIKLELIKKGVPKDIIEEAMAADPEEANDTKLIKMWIEKKHYHKEKADRKDKQKIYQFLLRKGFSHDDILYVLDHLT